jgi:ion channel-forming bestrophin family protein
MSATRALARLCITLADAKRAAPTYRADLADGFKKRAVYRLAALGYLARTALRFGPAGAAAATPELPPLLLEPGEYDALLKTQHAANSLLLLVGRDLYRAIADGVLGGFDSIQVRMTQA